MGTSAERSSSNTEYFKRGDLIPGLQVNGMDIIASYQAVKFAKQWVLDGKGPLLLEFVTYRYGGHSYVSFDRSRTAIRDLTEVVSPLECPTPAPRIEHARRFRG
jgi:TPP-dependent pyruvate/acetoin dehydrogenase alpha subunit